MIGSWKCPYCIMRSTRHWNVERHILNRHGELGQPISGLTKLGHTPKQYSDINTSYILGSMISDVRSTQLSAQKSIEQQPNQRFSDLLETRLLEPMRKIVEFNSLRSQLFRGTYHGTYQGGFSPLNFSNTRPSRSPASRDALHNIEDNPNKQQLFQPQGDFEIIAFRGYVCEQCLIAHPLPVYRWKVNESGKLTFEVPHKCDPKRLSEVSLIADRPSVLHDLYSNSPPEAVRTAVDQWTENENYLTSIELHEAPLTNNINAIKLNGRPDNYWMNRAIRETTTKLTDVELLDFLKKSHSNTCVHFKVLLPDKNRYFLMGISKSPL